MDNGPLYLLGNMQDLLEAMAKEAPVDPLAASTLFFVAPDSDDTLGNILTHYIEARLCALKVHLHVVTVDSSAIGQRSDSSGGSGSRNGMNGSSIYSYLDSVVYNPVAEFPKNVNSIKAECPCTSRCHESKFALFVEQGNGEVVRDILFPVFERRAHEMKSANKTFMNLAQPHIWRTMLRHSAEHLPEIPTVAIQYRCGDNTQPGYGLLAWPAFLKHIPSDVETIYIMTENPRRRVNGEVIQKCNDIINSLCEYLHRHFLSASVVVLRGADPLEDATRLAMSSVTICSASTFCFWPAIASKTRSYFPMTKLIYSNEGRHRYTPDFHWLTGRDELLLSLVQMMHVPTELMIEMLMKGQIILNDPAKTIPASSLNKRNSQAEGSTTVAQPHHIWLAMTFFAIGALFVWRKRWAQ